MWHDVHVGRLGISVYDHPLAANLTNCPKSVLSPQGFNAILAGLSPFCSPNSWCASPVAQLTHQSNPASHHPASNPPLRATPDSKLLPEQLLGGGTWPVK